MTTLEPGAILETLPNVDCHPATTAALDTDTKSLTISRNTVKPALVKNLLESVFSILTLVEGEMMKEDSFVELAGLCSKICHALEAVDDLAGFSEDIEDFGRIVSNIESGLRERANCTIDQREHPNMSTEACVNMWREELCGILSFFDRGGSLEPSSHSKNVQAPQRSEPGPGSAPVPIMHTSAPPIGKSMGSPNSGRDECDKQSDKSLHTGSAVPAISQQEGVDRTSEPPPVHISDSDKRALRRLVNSSVSQDELPSLITTIVSNVKPTDIAKCLEGADDAQTFIDTIDQTLETTRFALAIRRKCVKSLYKVCAGHSLLPRSLHFELPGNTMGEVKYRCGSADVLQRECGGREVAIKALRPRDLSLETMTNRFCKEVITWKSLQHPNVLPLLGVIMTGNQFAMVSEWMKSGNIKEFTAVHQDFNRFELLADVAKGLMHMHSQGMVHGDLKGANILVDGNGHACLADFGLLTIVSDVTNITCSNSFLEGGTCRWMGPELFNPEKFGLKDCRPTKASDCYALGMVVYEVLSGQVPFHRHRDYSVVVKVSEGERPERPQGAKGPWFGDDIWNLLRHCWEASPNDRPRIKDVLDLLDRVSGSWTPPPQTITNPQTVTSSTSELEASSEDSSDEGRVPSDEVGTVGAESLVRQQRALEGAAEKERLPALLQVMFEWMDNQKALNAAPFLFFVDLSLHNRYLPSLRTFFYLPDEV